MTVHFLIISCWILDFFCSNCFKHVYIYIKCSNIRYSKHVANSKFSNNRLTCVLGVCPTKYKDQYQIWLLRSFNELFKRNEFYGQKFICSSVDFDMECKSSNICRLSWIVFDYHEE